MKQVGYKVVIECTITKTVWFDENETHSEEDAIDWVFGNEMDNIKQRLKQEAYVDEILND